jgi:hypothetical protein
MIPTSSLPAKQSSGPVATHHKKMAASIVGLLAVCAVATAALASPYATCTSADGVMIGSGANIRQLKAATKAECCAAW